MNTNTLGIIIIGLVVIVYLAYQQLTDTYITPAKLWRVPLILAALAFVNLQNSLNNSFQLVELAGLFILGAAIGLVRGNFNRVELDRTANQIVVHGSVAGLLLWLGSLSVSITLRILLHNTDIAAAGPLVLMTGVFSGWRMIWQMKYTQLCQSYGRY